jgi:hypothetical protein
MGAPRTTGDPLNELRRLRAALADLVRWSDERQVAGRDPRVIAEYVTDVVDALITGTTVPVAPF